MLTRPRSTCSWSRCAAPAGARGPWTPRAPATRRCAASRGRTPTPGSCRQAPARCRQLSSRGPARAARAAARPVRRARPELRPAPRARRPRHLGARRPRLVRPAAGARSSCCTWVLCSCSGARRRRARAAGRRARAAAALSSRCGAAAQRPRRPRAPRPRTVVKGCSLLVARVCGAGRVHAPRRGRAGGAELVARCGRSRSGHWIRFSAPRVVSPAPPWRWDPAARHTHAVSRPEGEGTRQGGAGGRGPADGRSPESERARACACQRPAPPAAAGRRRARAGPASRVHTRRAVWRTGDRVLVFFESPHLTSHHASPRPDTSVSYILYIFIEIRIYRTALSLYT